MVDELEDGKAIAYENILYILDVASELGGKTEVSIEALKKFIEREIEPEKADSSPKLPSL